MAQLLKRSQKRNISGPGGGSRSRLQWSGGDHVAGIGQLVSNMEQQHADQPMVSIIALTISQPNWVVQEACVGVLVTSLRVFSSVTIERSPEQHQLVSCLRCVACLASRRLIVWRCVVFAPLRFLPKSFFQGLHMDVCERCTKQRSFHTTTV